MKCGRWKKWEKKLINRILFWEFRSWLMIKQYISKNHLIHIFIRSWYYIGYNFCQAHPQLSSANMSEALILFSPDPHPPKKVPKLESKAKYAYHAFVRWVWNKRQPHRKRTSQEDDLAGRRPNRKTTLQEDNLTGRQPHRKTTSQDNLTGRKPKKLQNGRLWWKWRVYNYNYE